MYRKNGVRVRLGALGSVRLRFLFSPAPGSPPAPEIGAPTKPASLRLAVRALVIVVKSTLEFSSPRTALLWLIYARESSKAADCNCAMLARTYMGVRSRDMRNETAMRIAKVKVINGRVQTRDKSEGNKCAQVGKAM